MAETAGINVFSYDPNRDAQPVVPRTHRPGLAYDVDGFFFTTNTSAEGSYDPLTESTTITASASAGSNTITVSSVKFIAVGQLIKIKDGSTEESIKVLSINTTTKVVTLDSNLANSYSSGSVVSMNRIKITTASGNVTIVDFIISDQNSDTTLMGVDIQDAMIWGDIRFKDNLHIEVYYVFKHPSYGWLEVKVGGFVRKAYLPPHNSGSGWTNYPLPLGADTASTLSPNLVVKMTHTAADSTERPHIIKAEVWRS